MEKGTEKLMAAVLEQSQTGGNAANSSGGTLTLDETATANNMLICCATRRSFSSGTHLLDIEDNNADNFTDVGDDADTFIDQGQSGSLCVIRYKVAEGDETEVVVNLTGTDTSEEWAAVALEYSGLETTAPLDAVFADSASGSANTSFALTGPTTSTANTLIIATMSTALTQSGAQTGHGWTNSFAEVVNSTPSAGGSDCDIAVASRSVSATGTYPTTMSWDDSSTACGVMAAFKVIVAAGGSSVIPVLSYHQRSVYNR